MDSGCLDIQASFLLDPLPPSEHPTIGLVKGNVKGLGLISGYAQRPSDAWMLGCSDGGGLTKRCLDIVLG